MEAVASVKPVFDANLLKASANFVVTPEINGSNLTSLKIEVQNMNGIPDGEYFLGQSNGQENAICSTVDSSGQCQGPDVGFFCHGPGSVNLRKCFSYDATTEELVLNAKFTLPGILFVDGNIRVERPDGEDIPLRNSLIATGNVSTANVGSLSAINYSTFNDVCQLDFAADPESPFAGQYPTNLCDFDNNALVYTTEGNLAIGAGTYDPATETYIGGNILFSSRSNIYGTVISGGTLEATNQTFLNGTVIALNQSQNSNPHKFMNEAVITFSGAPTSYNGFDVPLSVTLDQGADGEFARDGVHEPARVVWSKYN